MPADASPPAGRPHRRTGRKVIDHSGLTLGAVTVLHPIHGLSGAAGARYWVRWACCGTETDMLRRTIATYASKHISLTRCDACRRAQDRGPFNEPDADDPALVDDPRGVLQSDLLAAETAQARLALQREQADRAARIAARRKAISERLSRIAMGLLPTPPSSRVTPGFDHHPRTMAEVLARAAAYRRGAA